MVAYKRQRKSCLAWGSCISAFLRGWFAQVALILYVHVSVNIYRLHLCGMSITNLQSTGAGSIMCKRRRILFYKREKSEGPIYFNRKRTKYGHPHSCWWNSHAVLFLLVDCFFARQTPEGLFLHNPLSLPVSRKAHFLVLLHLTMKSWIQCCWKKMSWGIDR